jgi:hypothetical protein
VKGLKDCLYCISLNPVKQKRGQERDPFGVVKAGSSGGHIADVMADMTEAEYKAALNKVAGLKKLAETSNTSEADLNVFMELVLHGLAAFDVLSRERVQTGLFFKDHLAGEMDDDDDDDDMRDLLNRIFELSSGSLTGSKTALFFTFFSYVGPAMRLQKRKN